MKPGTREKVIQLSGYAGLITGSASIFLVISLNSIAYFGFGKASAIPFSQDWYSQWFPLYVIFSALLIGHIVHELILKKPVPSCVD